MARGLSDASEERRWTEEINRLTEMQEEAWELLTQIVPHLAAPRVYPSAPVRYRRVQMTARGFVESRWRGRRV